MPSQRTGGTYRIAYAMARALENYAIIGDHDEGTPNYKGDKALRRAIEVLESVREEGQDKAQWNMRMAYAYQYLYGQEEKAIPYAQRWAELDPEDEDAPAVIQECQEEIAKRAEAETEDESDHTGVFTGFVLLSKGEWDKEQFIRDMKEKWDITVDEYDASEEKDDDALVFEVGDMLAAVSLATYPIPNGEAELNAENNYMWEDAVKVAKEHRAHIMVAVLGKEEKLLEKGKLFTKLVAACCRQKYATGIYTSGVVFEPRFYEGFADMLQRGRTAHLQLGLVRPVPERGRLERLHLRHGCVRQGGDGGAEHRRRAGGPAGLFGQPCLLCAGV